MRNRIWKYTFRTLTQSGKLMNRPYLQRFRGCYESFWITYPLTLRGTHPQDTRFVFNFKRLSKTAGGERAPMMLKANEKPYSFISKGSAYCVDWVLLQFHSPTASLPSSKHLVTLGQFLQFVLIGDDNKSVLLSFSG